MHPTGIRWAVALIALILTASITSGCPREPSPQIVPAPPITVSRGLITAGLNRYIDAKTDEPFEQFGVTGVFASYDVEREHLVEHLLGARVPEPDLALDTCSSPSPVVMLMARRPTRRDDSGIETAIELIDVGDLSVTYADLSRAIPTRTFPDLLKVIDGVIYTADEAQGVQFVPGETYTLHATGTEEVSPFEVVLDAPDDLGIVKLDGVAPAERAPVIRRGEDLEIVWDGAGWGDEVIASLSWTGMGLPWSMTCRMRDDGLFVVPGQLIEGLHDPLASSDEEMTLSRVRQVAFRSSGLSSGAFSFVVSDSFPVRFEPGQ
jgi:hypothetical protein